MNTTLLHIRRFSGHDTLQKAVRDILALRADKKRIGIPQIERVSSYELRELLVFVLQWGHSSCSETVLCSTEHLQTCGTGQPILREGKLPVLLN